MKKFFSCVTFNECENSAYLSTRLYNFFKINNFQPVDGADSADIIVINTCGFDDGRENKASKIVNFYTKKYISRKTVVVTGCLPKINPGLFKDKRIITVAPKELRKFDEIFSARVSIEDIPGNVFNKELCFKNGFEDYYIQICQGCSSACSYCAIKKAKGNVTSKKAEQILSEFESGFSLGFSRFVLLADDCGSYGDDIGIDFSYLLNKIQLTFGRRQFQLNIHYFNPEKLLKLHHKINPDIYKRIYFMDIPLQSMSPRILKLMNRNYDIPAVLKIVRAIRLINPDMLVRTHIIYCFPSETRKDFALSFNLDKYFNSVAHFCYAEKRNTSAAFLPSESKINVFEKMWRTSLIMREREANSKTREVVVGGYSGNANEIYASIKKSNAYEDAQVLLIYPKSADDLNAGHPLSLLRVGRSLLEDGVSVRIVDERLENKEYFLEKLEQALAYNKLVCVGLSSCTASQFKSVIRIVNHIKSNVPVVLMGELATNWPDKVLGLGSIDYAVRGEEEAVFPRLVASLKGGVSVSSIKGLSYKSKNKKIIHNPDQKAAPLSNSERLPYYLLDDYLHRYSRVFIQTSRRCPGHKRTRFSPPEAVIGEIKNLQAFYQDRPVEFVDDNYFGNLKRVAAINSLLLGEIKGGRISPFEWCAQGGADDLLRISPELMRLLINSGLRSIVVRAGGADATIKATRFLRNFNINVEHALSPELPRKFIHE